MKSDTLIQIKTPTLETVPVSIITDWRGDRQRYTKIH